eukprot:UN31148
MTGPPLGGFLYDFGWDPVWQFRLPFVIFATSLVVTAVFVLYQFPTFTKPPLYNKSHYRTHDHATIEIEENPIDSRPVQIWNIKNCTTFGAIALSGTIVASLDPTLAYRLSDPPFYYDAGTVGLVFM